MDIKEFMDRWAKGMKEMTPAQQLHAKVVGQIGAIVGLILATVVMLYRGIWYFGVFMFFMIWMQVIQYIGLKQQYKATCEMMDDIEYTTRYDRSKEYDTELGNVR